MATILLIDDSELAMEITAEMLTMLGHQVRITSGPADFFRLLQSQPPPDLAIIDAVMPDMNGVEVINKVRAWPDPQLAQLPLVMATALDDQLPPAPGILMLTKPFTLDELQAVLDFALS